MAEVPSTFHLKTGQSAPDFTLPDGKGTSTTLSSLIEGRMGLIVAFVCNHCPFVVHLADALGTFAKECEKRGVSFVAISSNDAENYPADSPENMVRFAQSSGWEFPYLYDGSQMVAKSYAAACTPDFYLFNGDGRLTYAGQFDATRPGRGGSPTGDDLRGAVDDLLASRPTPEPWYPSSGCNIKWKPGESPDYFD
ncbi:MAG: thioredoxin family protein [Verrucomicrobiales bacterium]|jgi:peroxiredoxin|nr:thioredoxin family protein [Verrucomicrobiales bacterium]|tara:strand:+ start:8423 stop:9007 length:585 start_codon:yes stop_codon:yes gene_type:complete